MPTYTPDQIAAALDIMAQLPNIQDEELKEQCRTLAGKLTRMRDEEFRGIDFEADIDEQRESGKQSKPLPGNM